MKKCLRYQLITIRMQWFQPTHSWDEFYNQESFTRIVQRSKVPPQTIREINSLFKLQIQTLSMSSWNISLKKKTRPKLSEMERTEVVEASYSMRRTSNSVIWLSSPYQRWRRSQIRQFVTTCSVLFNLQALLPFTKMPSHCLRRSQFIPSHRERWTSRLVPCIMRRWSCTISIINDLFAAVA